MESSLTPSLWIQPSGPRIQGPHSSSWLLHRTSVGFQPSTGKSRTRPEPVWHDPNPQSSECSATGRGVCWHGKHSLGHKESQRIGPGSGANVAKYSTKPEISVFFPLFPPWTLYSARAEAWYRFECWNLSDSKTVRTVLTIMVENVRIWVLMRRVYKEAFIQQRLKL